jgi:hypothetical protein
MMRGLGLVRARCGHGLGPRDRGPWLSRLQPALCAARSRGALGAHAAWPTPHDAVAIGSGLIRGKTVWAVLSPKAFSA